MSNNKIKTVIGQAVKSVHEKIFKRRDGHFSRCTSTPALSSKEALAKAREGRQKSVQKKILQKEGVDNIYLQKT